MEERVQTLTFSHSSEAPEQVFLDPATRADLAAVAVRFPDYAGRYLLHCHNLEHEDAGMMLNFAVV